MPGTTNSSMPTSTASEAAKPPQGHQDHPPREAQPDRFPTASAGGRLRRYNRLCVIIALCVMITTATMASAMERDRHSDQHKPWASSLIPRAGGG